MSNFVLAATAADLGVFVVGAAVVLAGALGVVLFRNPVHCALSLILTLFGIAILFVAQEAHFLAAVQVIVYAGAIVVVFLFVIMLLGVDKPELRQKDPLRLQRPLAVVLGIATLALIVGLAGRSWDAVGASAVGGPASGPGSNVQKLADSLFTQYLFPFEATSVLLVIAVVGAVVLARRPGDRRSLPESDEIAGTGGLEEGATVGSKPESEVEAEPKVS